MLQIASAKGNRVTRLPQYREHVFRVLPQLQVLDGLDIHGNPVAIDAVSAASVAAAGPAPVSPPAQQQQQQQQSHLAGAAGSGHTAGVTPSPRPPLPSMPSATATAFIPPPASGNLQQQIWHMQNQLAHHQALWQQVRRC